MKQYKVIVKVWIGDKKGEDKFIKYHVRDLIKFTQFLDAKWPNWKWFNVFLDGEKVSSFTTRSRPASRRV